MKGTIAVILSIIFTICFIWFMHDGYKMAAKAGIGSGIGFVIVFFAVLVIILLVKNFLEKE